MLPSPSPTKTHRPARKRARNRDCCVTWAAASALWTISRISPSCSPSRIADAPMQLRASAKGWAALYLRRRPWTSRMRVTIAEHQKRALDQG